MIPVEGRTVREVLADLSAALDEAGVLDEGDGFGMYGGLAGETIAGTAGDAPDLPWPTEAPWGDMGVTAWIACFAVRGGSEGWYRMFDMRYQPTVHHHHALPSQTNC